MTLSIWLIIISLVVIVGMISYRSYELSYDKKLISDEKRLSCDKKVLTFLDKNIKLFNRLSDRLKMIPELFFHKIHDFWKVVSKKIDFHFDKAKKKKSENNKKGSISIHWQKFSENKDKEDLK
jgi:hypothetical protein